MNNLTEKDLKDIYYELKDYRKHVLHTRSLDEIDDDLQDLICVIDKRLRGVYNYDI